MFRVFTVPFFPRCFANRHIPQYSVFRTQLGAETCGVSALEEVPVCFLITSLKHLHLRACRVQRLLPTRRSLSAPPALCWGVFPRLSFVSHIAVLKEQILAAVCASWGEQRCETLPVQTQPLPQNACRYKLTSVYLHKKFLFPAWCASSSQTLGHDVLPAVSHIIHPDPW